jgi:hypothetical protein
MFDQYKGKVTEVTTDFQYLSQRFRQRPKPLCIVLRMESKYCALC